MASTSFGKPIPNSLCWEARLQGTRGTSPSITIRRRIGESQVYIQCMIVQKWGERSAKQANQNRASQAMTDDKKECGPGQPPEPHSQA